MAWRPARARWFETYVARDQTVRATEVLADTFALGHAALSLAIMTLAVAVVLVLGNLFSLVLEGLVVYVQTTRLVLFEFFTRFLREEGQLFRPLRRSGAPS